MSKFKIGDKVAVYDSRLVDGRQIGIVDSFDPNSNSPGSICISSVKRVDHKYISEVIVNPKQCRMIKIKSKKPYIFTDKEIDAADAYSAGVYEKYDAFTDGISWARRNKR